ncbi:MAG: phenylalanine 4-monooxygenase [Alphaproteobacteria bacterium]|nr:phenylalanine 4-monooxygenase [Alphaproteobacteria bacterium]
MPTLDLAERRRTDPETRDDWTVPQHWNRLTPAQHGVWRTLYQRMMSVLPGRACGEYLDGLRRLPLGADGVPDFRRLSDALSALTGWQVVAVPGLVPDDVFFEHLANRRFPAGNFIRSADTLDYIEEPDVFHDVFGHVPMLAHPVFADYMQAYGQGGLRAEGFDSLDHLARLYWYTVEFGLIATPEGMRIYGSGIVSSRAESVYALESPSPNRIAFNLERVMRTKYRIDDFQESYFVIPSFEALLNETYKDFAPLYGRLETGPTHEAGTLIEGDAVLHRGDRSYRPHSHAASR